MVRILTYLYIAIQVAILVQIDRGVNGTGAIEWLPSLHNLKVFEIIVFIPIILVLARRTRLLRDKVNCSNGDKSSDNSTSTSNSTNKITD